MTISHWINVTWHTVSLSSSDLSLDQW
jgi:hypothetical protein